MPNTIAILEDSRQRIDRMQAVLAESFSGYDAVVLTTAPEMLDWLAGCSTSCALLSLDYDLGSVRSIDGRPAHPGSGGDVLTKVLVSYDGFGVVVHTGDSMASAAMAIALENAARPHRVVTPSGFHDWIAAEWAAALRELLA